MNSKYRALIAELRSNIIELGSSCEGEIAKKNLQKPTPEQVKLFEEKTGLKVIDVEKTILQTDDGIMWRPFKNQAEFLCACWDGVEILNVGKCPFVPNFWKP